MTKLRVLLLVGLLAALPLSGCIENMRDLKDHLGATEEPVDTAATDNETLDVPEVPTNDTTKPAKPPVARITVFGANGALVYKSSFEAADPAEPVFVRAPVTLQLLASDSETLEAGATITDYTWDFAGMTMTGSKVEHALSEPGNYPLSLTVKDSAGGVDTHNVTIAISPEPFDVVEEITTSPVVGVDEGTGAYVMTGTASYALSLTRDDKPHKVTSLTFVTKGGNACDPILTITAPDGTVVGPQDSGSQETIAFTDAAEGTYEISADGYACVAPEGLVIEVTATFVQVVEGVAAGGDGHGHAH